MTKIPAPLKWLVVSVALQASVFAAPAKPNVILIVTDDQGYADVGCYGGEGVETPNLDRLAAQGARFTDYYAANSVCSPSRASILTGRYATRCGVPEVLGPGAGKYLKGFQLGLPPGETTIAELLKEAGYATACIGKWHLGHEERYLPTRQGFDEFFGQPYSNDMPIDPLHANLAEDIKLNGGATRGSIQAGDHAKEKTCPSGQPTDNPEEFHTPLMIGDEVVEFPVDQETLTERYTDEAIAFMDRSAGKPFFIYLAHTMPHVPLAATEAFRSGKPRAGYADTIKELDHNIGRLLDHLEKTGSANNTLVMFTSDNGPLGQSPAFGGSARPLKGFKFQTHEGGQRVPFIVRWPSVVPAGEVISQVTSALDILPTVAAATGIAVPKNIDGTSLLPRAAVFDTPAWVWNGSGPVPATDARVPQRRSADKPSFPPSPSGKSPCLYPKADWNSFPTSTLGFRKTSNHQSNWLRSPRTSAPQAPGFPISMATRPTASSLPQPSASGSP